MVFTELGLNGRKYLSMEYYIIYIIGVIRLEASDASASKNNDRATPHGEWTEPHHNQIGLSASDENRLYR
jgi:hypothetical protein